MISKILFEFQKIFQKKNLIFFLSMICVLNIAVFIYDQQSQPTFPTLAYAKLNEKLENIPNQQRYQYIKNEYEKYHAFQAIETLNQLKKNEADNQYLIDSLLQDNPKLETTYQSLYQKNHQTYYTDSIESEVAFLEDIYHEFEVLHQYPTYLKNIQDKVQTLSSISIFQKDNDFASSNIQKTASDYQNLFNIELTYESEKGIHAALSFPMTHILVVIAMFVLSSSMIIDEKEKKLFSIMKITPQGQWSLMLAKCIVMVMMVGILTLIMISTQLIYMHFTIGLGDLSRTIQSLASYNYCSFHLNVWQFLLLFFYVKWIATSFIGLFMMWLTIMTHHKTTSLIWIVFIIGVELILYLVISPLDSIYLLKYLNFISFLQIDTLFQIYRNVNFIGYPLSLQWLMILVLVIGFIGSMILCVTSYHYKRNMEITPLELPFHWQHLNISLSLFHQELFKVFHLQRVLVLCMICVGLQIYQYHDMTIYKNQDTMIYMEYMKKLEGHLTSEKEKWIEEEKEHYESLHQQQELIVQRKENKEITQEKADTLLNRINQELVGEEVFSQVLEQYQRIQNNPQCEFVIPYAYQNVFLQSLWTMLPTIVLCLFLLIGLSQVFPFEYQNQMQRMTHVSINGHQKIIRYKILVSIIICFIFMLIVMLPIFILFQNAYGFSSLSASIISIEQLSSLPSYISIGMGCLISLILKFFGLVCMVVIIHAIAVKTKNYILTCFISALLFLVPLLLSYGNFHILDTISLYPLLMNGQYVTDMQGLIQLFCSFIGYLILMIGSLKYIYKHY